MRSYHPHVRVERDGHVVCATLDNRPPRTPAPATCGWPWAPRSGTSPTRAPRAVLLTGAGGHFCAGADLTGGTGARSGSGDGDRRATMVDAMRVIGEVVLAVHDCPVPVVSVVDEVCVGAGLGLALAADMHSLERALHRRQEAAEPVARIGIAP
jgi:enoyl-CoA hydratase/carnithine racemase